MIYLGAFILGIATYIAGVIFGSWIERRFDVGKEGFLVGFLSVVVIALFCFCLLILG